MPSLLQPLAFLPRAIFSSVLGALFAVGLFAAPSPADAATTAESRARIRGAVRSCRMADRSCYHACASVRDAAGKRECRKRCVGNTRRCLAAARGRKAGARGGPSYMKRARCRVDLKRCSSRCFGVPREAARGSCIKSCKNGHAVCLGNRVADAPPPPLAPSPTAPAGAESPAQPAQLPPR